MFHSANSVQWSRVSSAHTYHMRKKQTSSELILNISENRDASENLFIFLWKKTGFIHTNGKYIYSVWIILTQPSSGLNFDLDSTYSPGLRWAGFDYNTDVVN